MAEYHAYSVPRHEIQAYLKERQATAEERREVWEWVRDGNSVYENPWQICAESGRPMDFLSGMRADREFCEMVAAMPPQERDEFLGVAPHPGDGELSD